MDYNEEIAKEMNAILVMTTLSDKQGLLPEVIWSLIRSIKPDIKSDDIISKCNQAMNEWGI